MAYSTLYRDSGIDGTFGTDDDIYTYMLDTGRGFVLHL